MHNILMLTPYLPYPPVSGGRSRTFNLIKRLVRDYQITLLCFARPEERAFDLAPLLELCEVVIIDRASSPGALRAAVLSATSIRPITMRLYASPNFRETLRRLLRVRLFDLVHVESFYMMQNLPHDYCGCSVSRLTIALSTAGRVKRIRSYCTLRQRSIISR